MESGHRIPLFASLGMFIIDEISFPDLQLDGILGGGGTFAICGSRMVLGAAESTKCAWIVDIGNDCPGEILHELKSWNSGAVFRYDDSRKCTRGWNGYGANEFRSFKYLTSKKRITMADFEQYPWMLWSKSFHFVCSPKRCKELLDELKIIYGTHHHELEFNNVIIAWEPIPDCCQPEFLDETLGILKQVDILTPNAAECASFFGEEEPSDRKGCERIALKFLGYMAKPAAGIVLRCGHLGSMYAKSDKKVVWFPAYHHKTDNKETNKVIDPTGCGNTFVGAFTTAFVKFGKNYHTSALYATIASGACIEQHGLPRVTHQGEDELWNGVSVKARVKIYLEENPELITDSVL
jgi:sugar/nucleoside kinase (ribokinase family)